MKRTIKRIFVAVLFLAGLSLLLYPFVSNQWNNYRQKRLISDYDQTVRDLAAGGGIDYEAEWERAFRYNDALLPSILPDSFAEAEISGEDAEYMACLNIGGNGIMGTVEVPKIEIILPIFHTTNDDVLQTAAGHLEGSSLPVGGEDTHCVISAHRGLPSASLFTDLDQMEEGDHFLLHILDDTLAYEVDQIVVVEPDDTKELEVQDGMDLVTLMTCTPYGVNSQRLFVRGHRVPYVPEEIAKEEGTSGFSFHTNYLLWVIVGIGVTAIFSFFLYKRQKRLERKAEAGKAEQSSQEKPPEEAEPSGEAPSEEAVEAPEAEQPPGEESSEEEPLKEEPLQEGSSEETSDKEEPAGEIPEGAEEPSEEAELMEEEPQEREHT